MNTINFLKSSMNIKFIQPVSKRGNPYLSKNFHDAFITIGIKGNLRKSSRYELNIKHLSRKYKLSHWKYVKIGFYEDALIICEGTSNDGYIVSGQNVAITNQHLIISILNFFKLNVPHKADESSKIYFKADKLDNYINYFKLNRI